MELPWLTFHSISISWKPILTAALFIFVLTSFTSYVYASHVSCGDIITSDTVLDNDLVNCLGNGIEIEASDITLDCQDHKIVGNRTLDIPWLSWPLPSGKEGIIVRNIENITIKNCVIENFNYGIYFESILGSRLVNNTAYGNIVGFELVYSKNNTLLSNIVNNSSYYGVHLNLSSNNSMTNNVINNNTLIGSFLYFSDFNILNSNTANNNRHGFLVGSSSDYNTFNSNTANNNSIGFSLSINNNNNLTNNTAYNNSFGISLAFSDYNTLTFNTINNNNYGLSLFTSSYSNVINNKVNNNSIGLLLSQSNSNTIDFNTIRYNVIGINITYSNNNLIYNNFFNNTRNAIDNSNNFWNITKTDGANIIGGPFLGGNFWNNYNGVDLDGDGLGDTLTPHNGDFLPLVSMDGDTPMLPQITFSSPSDPHNKIVNRTYTQINVSVNATVDINTCILEWNGTNISMEKLNSEKSAICYINKTDNEGTYNYRVYVSDILNNVNSSDERNITFDITKPIIIGYTPINGSYTTGSGNITFTVRYSEANLYPSVIFFSYTRKSLYYYGFQDEIRILHIANLTYCQSGINQTCSYTLNISTYPDNHFVQWWFDIFDWVGQSAFNDSSRYNFLTIDRTPPQYIIPKIPLMPSMYDPNNITNFNVSPNVTIHFGINWTESGIAWVENSMIDTQFIEENFTGTLRNTSMATIHSLIYDKRIVTEPGSPYVHSSMVSSVYSTKLQPGTYQYRYFANDTANNWNATNISYLIVNSNNDPKPPTIKNAIASPRIIKSYLPYLWGVTATDDESGVGKAYWKSTYYYPNGTVFFNATIFNELKNKSGDTWYTSDFFYDLKSRDSVNPFMSKIGPFPDGTILSLDFLVFDNAGNNISTNINSTMNFTDGIINNYVNLSVSTIDNQTFLNATSLSILDETLLTSSDTTLLITTNQNVSSGIIAITLYNQNPKSIGFPIQALGKYVEIDSSSNINDSLSRALIKIYYNDSDIPSGYNETDLMVYYNHHNGTWIDYNNQSSDFQGGVNTEENYVWVNTTHFSLYGIYFSKQTPSLFLTANPEWTINQDTQTTVSCSADTTKVTVKLYRNNVEVSNPDIQTLSAGSYSYVCNNTETTNYTTTSVSNILTVNPTSTDGDGGTTGGGGTTSGGFGGGGGGGILPYAGSLISEGLVADITLGSPTTFAISGITHTITLKKINSITATFEISSTPINVTLNLNETKKNDFEDDSFYDMEIKLNSISGLKASITLKAIKEAARNLTVPEEYKKSEENITIPTTPREPIIPTGSAILPSTSTSLTIIFAIAVIAISILYWKRFTIFKKTGKKKF